MRNRGFTLAEAMVVIAIIGVISALAATTAQRIGARNATQNAASEISTLMQKARSRAELTGSDVYVIVYPNVRRSDGSANGRGALFVYEDTNGNFLSSTGTCAGTGTVDCGFGNFAPPNNIRSPTTSADRLVDALYLDDYPKQNVKFGKLASTTYPSPFTSAGSSAGTTGCSFCSVLSGSLRRGAIVFTGEQQLRFLDASGAPVSQRIGGIAVQGVDSPDNSFFFGLVRSTGLVTLVK